MSESTTENDNRNPFTRPGFILSAALIVALIAAVLVIAFLPRNGNDEATTPTPAATSSAATAEPSAAQSAAAGESVCGLSGSSETALGAAPESNWELTGTMAVPSDPAQVGPGEATDSGTPYCFAATPTGALYAATNIFASLVYGDQMNVFQQQVASGPERDEAIAALQANGVSSTPANPAFQVQGFQLQRYSTSAATVVLGFNIENGSVGSITMPLVWEDGDWKLALEQSGPPEPRQLNDLTGFIPWSGV
ncbi:hypothetical protein [Arthrobacter bussei]|uniref:DUF8175 domain-containing protein n=1 Tax=Arthrobacter bussei TaxID=2594179 RepID=A0A7X1NT25_9MICC|nr:hypothetical protein [Arthrobacter bussei]MPY12275.1 hypothetical protein [Arthrobacter bussei]